MSDGLLSFDRLFQELLIPEAEAPPGPSGGSGGSSGPPGVAGESIEEQIRVALALFYEGRYAHCLKLVEPLSQAARREPRVSALSSACEALLRGRLRPAVRPWLHLLEAGSHLGDAHCALGVLLLKARRRSQAYSVFRRGLRAEPRHDALRAQLDAMGIRRAPVLRFLPRSHLANRWLGFFRARVLAS